jgi:hypothetical protein
VDTLPGLPTVAHANGGRRERRLDKEAEETFEYIKADFWPLFVHSRGRAGKPYNPAVNDPPNAITFRGLYAPQLGGGLVGLGRHRADPP